MRSVPVIFEYIIEEVGVALVAGLITAAISPLSDESLDKALGLTVGLGAIGPGEDMFDAAHAAGVGEGVGGVKEPLSVMTPVTLTPWRA